MTDKLYYKDSFIKEFEATVIAVADINGRFGAVLDKTAFFPEGGGQKGDSGTINGIEVSDTIIKDDTIYHIMDKPLNVGEKVQGLIDWDKRFTRMQNHTGEHIVSGILHSLYGVDNVGFALYDGYFTFDTSIPLSEEQIRLAERKANEAVFACAEVKAFFPTAEELKTLEYRSKKEIEGDVRIVEVIGYDKTACCAPMVKNTGQLGLIKLLDFMNFKGGSRIWAVCGRLALDDYNIKQKNTEKISELLCAPKNEISSAVEALYTKKESLEKEITALKTEMCLPVIEGAEIKNNRTAVFGDFDPSQQRFIANELSRKCDTVGVFSGNDNDGYLFTLKSENNFSDVLNEFKNALSAKGGGKPPMATGRCDKSKSQIKEFFRR